MTPLSTATLDIVPGRSVGPFCLGDSLWKTLEYLRTHKAEFPKINVGWDVENAASSAIIIQVIPHIVLTFPSTTPGPSIQLLQHIRIIQLPEATKSKRVRVVYKGQELGASDQARVQVGTSTTPVITNKTIERAVGPTWTPSDSKAGSSGQRADPRLTYRGVSFGLSCTASTNETIVNNRTGTKSQAESRPKDKPVLDLAVYNQRVYEDTGGKDLELGVMLDLGGNVKGELDAALVTDVMVGMLKRCEVVPGKHVILHFFSPQTSASSADLNTLTITINHTTAQDLLLDLGPPLRKYWKEDNRLSEVWGRENGNGSGGSGGRGGSEGGCWWNYFQHGMDFLIAEEGRYSGKVIKVMMHSNIPGTALFQRHAKCPWTILPPASSRAFTCADKLEDVMAAVPGTSRTTQSSRLKTMSLDRTIEGGLEGVTGIEPSRLAATDGLVLEEAHGGGITGVLVV